MITGAIVRKKRITAVVNPQPARRNPGPATVLLGYLNPHKEKRHMPATKKPAKKKNPIPFNFLKKKAAKRNPSALTVYKAKAKAPGRRRPAKRNPFSSNILSKPIELLKAGAIGALSYFATRQVPQAVLKARNTSFVGYLANLLTALGCAGLADKYFGSPAGQAAFVGGGMYLFTRVLNEQTPYGATLALSGVGDVQATGLRGIVPGYYAHPPITTRDGAAVIPQQIVDAVKAQLPAPAPQMAAAAAGVGRFASRF